MHPLASQALLLEPVRCLLVPAGGDLEADRILCQKSTCFGLQPFLLCMVSIFKRATRPTSLYPFDIQREMDSLIILFLQVCENMFYVVAYDLVSLQEKEQTFPTYYNLVHAKEVGDRSNSLFWELQNCWWIRPLIQRVKSMWFFVLLLVIGYTEIGMINSQVKLPL